MARQNQSASLAKLANYLGRGAQVLDKLGAGISQQQNPVWLALAGLGAPGEWEIEAAIERGEMTEREAESLLYAARAGAELAEKLPLWKGKTANKGAILRAYAVCQTAVLNANGGPIGDGSLSTIRQRWYFSKVPQALGFKMASQQLELALIRTADIVLVDDERAYNRAHNQGAKKIAYKTAWKKADDKALAEELGRPVRTHIWPKAGWGRTYAQTQSAILADLVRDGLTYDELWTRDASRDVITGHPLIKGFHAVLVLEKQGLFEHFIKFAQNAGIRVLVAMGGNNAFSCVEAILNDNFRAWEGHYHPTPENPLHLFSIRDWDYYGAEPVEAGVAAQFERYLPGAVVVHNVGITPQQLADYGRSAVQAGYEFEADYNSSTLEWALEYGIWIGDTCYGVEVEALTPDQYLPYLIDAIVEACGGDDALRKALAKAAEPEWYTVESEIESKAYPTSKLWALLDALEKWAEQTRLDEIERPIDRFTSRAIERPQTYRCSCGYEFDTDPDDLYKCPECTRDLTDSAEYDYDSRTYRCSCGEHETERDPWTLGACPECGNDLYRADIGPAWKESETVRAEIGEAIAAQQDQIDLEHFKTHAQAGWGAAWQPVDSQAANQVAIELFGRTHGQGLCTTVENADREAEPLIDALENVYDLLVDFGLERP